MISNRASWEISHLLPLLNTVSNGVALVSATTRPRFGITFSMPHSLLRSIYANTLLYFLHTSPTPHCEELVSVFDTSQCPSDEALWIGWPVQGRLPTSCRGAALGRLSLPSCYLLSIISVDAEVGTLHTPSASVKLFTDESQPEKKREAQL